MDWRTNIIFRNSYLVIIARMNNAFFFDSAEYVPLPPEEVRLTDFNAQPYPDGKRVRVMVEATPFQKRPWIEVTMLDAEGDEVAYANIVEPMNYKVEITMHIRRAEPSGKYSLTARLFYPEQPDNDKRTIEFEVTETQE